MSLAQLKTLIRHATPAQRKKLFEWLGELIRKDLEAGSQDISESRPSMVEESADGRTYRLQSVRCGKKGCKCNEGKLHGPYWYAYWSEGVKTRSQYVGKKLPERSVKRTKRSSK